jgi:hypothetical protein
VRTWVAAVRRWEKLILVGLVVLGCAGGELWWRHGDDGPDVTSGQTCLTSVGAKSGSLTDVGCDVQHEYEVVRTLKGDDAEQRCREEADRFLGGAAGEGRVVVELLHAKVGGNTDLRPCAVAEVSDTRGTIVGRVLGMKGSMAGERRLAITCTGRLDDAGDADFRACSAPHTGELVGVLTDGEAAEAGCAAAAGRYVGDGFAARTDLELHAMERGRTLCFAVDVTGEDLLRASLKGIGGGPLPR